MILSSFPWEPPICLHSPPGDRVPLPLAPGAPCGGLLGLPFFPPLQRSITLKCGSWWSPFSLAASSALRMCLPDRIYSSCRGGSCSYEEWLSRLLAMESRGLKGRMWVFPLRSWTKACNRLSPVVLPSTAVSLSFAPLWVSLSWSTAGGVFASTTG